MLPNVLCVTFYLIDDDSNITNIHVQVMTWIAIMGLASSGGEDISLPIH